MPAGEGVSTGGWDGSVRSTSATAYVPQGLSLWELSVEKGVGGKADEDYDKRLTTPDGSPTNSCTYIALSLRRWRDRTSWASGRATKGRWASVRAYGLDDVEAWLETASVTWAWISEVLGYDPHGLRAAEAWWNSWAARTDPPMTTGVVLAGRSQQLDELQARLTAAPSVTTISGASVDEILAFIAATGVHLDGTGAPHTLARMAFVDDAAAWRRLVSQSTPLVLVPLREDLVNEISASSVHHIVVPTPTSTTADIELPRLDSQEATEALTAAGVSDRRKAEGLGRLARQSLTALRRRVAVKPELHVPAWATAPIARTTRAVLLAGRWNDANPADQEVLALLAGKTYDNLLEGLDALASPADPLITQVGDAWSVVSDVDAWLLLHPGLRPDDLGRLQEVAERVLQEPDPSLELSPNERWQASVLGKVRRHSSDLRQGVAASLALLAAHGDAARGPSRASGSAWAAHLVRELMDAANEDSTGTVWNTVAPHLPILAEAAPSVVLDALRAGVTGDTPVLAKVFSDKDGDALFGPSSGHTHILWALEGLAWSPEFLGAVSDILARLDSIDPGGRLTNRPQKSLSEILCPWHPETAAGAESRLRVLDALRRRHPSQAWRLMVAMLPERRGVHHSTHEPTYRDWSSEQPRITNREWWDFTAEVVSRVLEDVGTTVERWAEVLDRLTALGPSDRERVIEQLHALRAEGSLESGDSEAIALQLSKLIGRHREFADADWSLGEEDLARLDSVAEAMAPSTAYASVMNLFTDHRPYIGDTGRRDDYAAYERELASQRARGVAAVYEEGGLDLVKKLASTSVVAWTVGVGLADATDEAHDVDLLTDLEASSGFELEMSHAFYARRFESGGWEWLREVLATQGTTALQKARLLLAARDFPEAWGVAATLGDDVRREYWKHFRTFGLGADFAHVEEVATNLLDVGRYAMALDFLEMYIRRSDQEQEASLVLLVVRGLQSLLLAEDGEIAVLSEWDFEQLFEILESHRPDLGDETVAQLEWGFLPALGIEPNAPALHAAMAQNPNFFVEVLSTVFRRRSARDDANEESEPMDQARATNAYRLLSSWAKPPGLQEDGSFAGDGLRAWVREVQPLLREADRYEVGMTHIGEVLAAAPPDPDGSWPPMGVRDLFEELQDEHVEDGFRIQILNSRGITSRAPGDGGGQERDLVSKYRSDAAKFNDDSPRTAQILRSVAASYDADARRNEEGAERFRQGLDR